MLDDSWCFLWVTNSTLWREGPAVLRAWGFEPIKSPITWFKGFIGRGSPLRNSTEHLLVGRRGRPSYAFRGQPTHLIAPRGRHSEKPAEQIALIERFAGSGPYLEIFARTRPNERWSVWGLEAPGGSDVEIPGYPVPLAERAKETAWWKEELMSKKTAPLSSALAAAFTLLVIVILLSMIVSIIQRILVWLLIAAGIAAVVFAVRAWRRHRPDRW
jgi:MT-A70